MIQKGETYHILGSQGVPSQLGVVLGFKYYQEGRQKKRGVIVEYAGGVKDFVTMDKIVTQKGRHNNPRGWLAETTSGNPYDAGQPVIYHVDKPTKTDILQEIAKAQGMPGTIKWVAGLGFKLGRKKLGKSAAEAAIALGVPKSQAVHLIAQTEQMMKDNRARSYQGGGRKPKVGAPPKVTKPRAPSGSKATTDALQHLNRTVSRIEQRLERLERNQAVEIIEPTRRTKTQPKKAAKALPGKPKQTPKQLPGSKPKKAPKALKSSDKPARPQLPARRTPKALPPAQKPKPKPPSKPRSAQAGNSQKAQRKTAQKKREEAAQAKAQAKAQKAFEDAKKQLQLELGLT